MRARSPTAAIWILVAAGLSMVGGCQGDPPLEIEPFPLASWERVPAQAWTALANERICFGHQSVGADIMLGVEEVVARRPEIALTVRDIPPPGALDTEALEPGEFAHTTVGRNSSYASKLEAFTEMIDGGLDVQCDIALLKFCYVDIMPTTDIETLHDAYEKTLADLEARHPGTTFIRMSSPLTWRLTGWESLVRSAKDLVKEALGKSGYGRFFDNGPRHRFNDMLRAGYGESGLFFDLAAVESVRSDGSRAAYGEGSGTYFALAREYTDDGGHLNASGRRQVAEQLLIFLAEVALRERTAEETP